MSVDYVWISQNGQWDELISHLHREEPIGLDTEADSLHHYQESLCLIQISQHGRHYLVDPLAPGLDLRPLWDALRGSTWILQGADYDLRMLRGAGAADPPAVFDTMLAGQLLGHQAFGYAALVKQYFQQTICKKNQTADWSRRPLSKSMLDYAMQDTLYLEPLEMEMTRELEAKGRLDWHRQSSERVRQASRFERERDADNEWRIRGANALQPAALAIVKELYYWREREAEQADKPPFKVMANEMLLALARFGDEKRSIPPEGWSRWPHRASPGRLKRLAQAIVRGRQAEPIARLKGGKRPEPNPEFEKRFDRLKNHRDQVAKDIELDASLIASRQILIELARDPENSPAELITALRWCPWQAELMKLA
ncbi:MAG: HRDC domain-containing protein [Verrucomicrobiota bacterium]